MQDEETATARQKDESRLLLRRPVVRRGYDRPRAALLALAVVAVIAFGALVPSQWHDYRYAQDNSAAQLRLQGSRAADRMVLALTSPSANDADKYVADLLKVATGPFKDQLAQIAQKLASTVKAAGVTATSSITSSGVSSVDTAKRTVIVVVTVTQTLKNNNAPQGEPRYYRMRVTTLKRGDTWLVSDARFVA